MRRARRHLRCPECREISRYTTERELAKHRFRRHQVALPGMCQRCLGRGELTLVYADVLIEYPERGPIPAFSVIAPTGRIHSRPVCPSCAGSRVNLEVLHG